jgi:ribonuclease HI
LTFKEHNNYIKTKTTDILNKLLRFSKSKFGLNSKALSTIYKGCILPIISYGISVWIDSIDRKYNKHYLEVIQRRVALRQCKAYKTVSTNACNVICKLVPIDLYLKARAVEYFLKKDIQNNLTDEYISGTGIETESLQKPFNLIDSFHPGHMIPLKIVQNSSQMMITFSGHKSTRGVGAAFEIWDSNRLKITKKFKLSENCSIFQSSLFAIHSALQHINRTFQNRTYVTICSDNQTVIKAISNPYTKNSQVHHIYVEVFKAKTKHISIDLLESFESDVNERLNQTKQKAIEAMDSHSRIAYDLISESYIKRLLKKETLKNGNKYGRHQRPDNKQNYFFLQLRVD